MAFDRRKWTASFRRKWAPAWPCPTCRNGTLAIEADTLIAHETASSRRAHRHHDWDPEWIEYTFTAWLKCSNTECGEHVAVAGTGGEEIEVDDDGRMTAQPYYTPKYVHPAPDLFEIPAKCPKPVSETLREAFGLYWHDHPAAANRVRVAIEKLLDALGVKERKRTKAGGFEDLSLHKRIEELTKSEPQAGAQLMAIKWLGNEGSHNAQAGRDDLLDAFEILEHTLAELIDQRARRVAQLAKELHKKHARKRRKRR